MMPPLIRSLKTAMALNKDAKPILSVESPVGTIRMRVDRLVHYHDVGWRETPTDPFEKREAWGIGGTMARWDRASKLPELPRRWISKVTMTYDRNGDIDIYVDAALRAD